MIEEIQTIFSNRCGNDDDEYNKVDGLVYALSSDTILTMEVYE